MKSLFLLSSALLLASCSLGNDPYVHIQAARMTDDQLQAEYADLQSRPPAETAPRLNAVAREMQRRGLLH